MKRTCIYLLVVVAFLIFAMPVLAEDSSELLTIATGQSQLLKLEKVQRVAVTDPTIAEVVVVSASEVLINGVKTGVTTLHIWMDGGGYKRYILRIDDDSTYIAAQINTMIKSPNVQVSKVKGTVVLQGTVENQYERDKAVQIAGAFGDKVVDLLQVKHQLQVQVKAYVVELNREKFRDLGLTWGGLVRGVYKRGQVLFGQLNVNQMLNEIDPIGAQLKALEDQKLSRTLAAPELVAMNGSKSEILVGGEIPIIKANEVIWKPYGIILTVTPTVLASGQIQVDLEPEISTVDWDNAVKLGDFTYPAFRTRRVKTCVTVDDGSSIVLGGLINQSDVEEVNKVPFLGDVPIIGELFRSHQFRKNETELVVIVETRVLNEEVLNASEDQRKFVQEQQFLLEETVQDLREED